MQVIGFNWVTQHLRAVFRVVTGVVVAACAVAVFAVAIAVAAETRDITRGSGHLSPTLLEAALTVGDEGALNSAVSQLVTVPGMTTVAVGGINGGSKQDSRIILRVDKVKALGASHMESPGDTVSINTR